MLFCGVVLLILGASGLTAGELGKLAPATSVTVTGFGVLALLAGALLLLIRANRFGGYRLALAAPLGVGVLVSDHGWHWMDPVWWKPWTVGAAILLIVIGTFSGLIEFGDDFEGPGLAALAILLGVAAAFVGTFVDLGGWSPVLQVLGTALAGFPAAAVPLAYRDEYPETPGLTSPLSLAAQALNGFAVIATGVMAIVVFGVPVWAGLLISLVDLVGAVLLLPPLACAWLEVVKSPAARKLRSSEALSEARLAVAFGALAVYLVMLIILGSLWWWVDLLAGAGAVVSLLGIVGAVMEPKGKTPPATEPQVVEASPVFDETPVGLAQLFPVQPEPVLPIPMAEPAPRLGQGGTLIADALGELTARQDRVFRLLPHPVRHTEDR
ncbi:hypothetical protein [Amycolatopsis sp. H20-H5]|uniref:hypothetical protein n=1 Tax=Amycolatopsis sp. H20-H5 TaxID=3046309 RepID=UPI002DB94EA0|nr:hypothetical protein [Amycolatopsis sp. H20-H5]MEC3981628.1 hypothetical protein [Amycolatopsis sp. H20-H5]